MSENALKDLNVLPVSELAKRNDGSNKGNLMKPCVENSENFEKNQNRNTASLSLAPLNVIDARSNGEEVGASEVEYIESENLTDLPAVDASLNTLLARLDSKEWLLICEALNNVRQLSVYHKETFSGMLGDVIPLIVKSLKNPRSAVCKTAIMTSADMFKVYSDLLIDSLDPLLTQLLLKSSQDKRFVCEAAEKALTAMTTWVSPSVLLSKLQPYLKNKNPRIRAKASMCFSRSVPRLGRFLSGYVNQRKLQEIFPRACLGVAWRDGKVCSVRFGGCVRVIEIISPIKWRNLQFPVGKSMSKCIFEGMEGIKAYGIDILIQIAASQLSDQLPESREAARTLALELQAIYEKSQATPSEDSNQLAATDSWEDFCQAKLSPLSAQAILRVTSTPKEGLIVSC